MRRTRVASPSSRAWVWSGGGASSSPHAPSVVISTWVITVPWGRTIDDTSFGTSEFPLLLGSVQSKHDFVDASIHHKRTVLVVPGTRIPPERTAACGANDAASRECFLPTLLLSSLLSVMVFRTPRDAERAFPRLARGPRDGTRRDVKQHARPDPLVSAPTPSSATMRRRTATAFEDPKGCPVVAAAGRPRVPTPGFEPARAFVPRDPPPLVPAVPVPSPPLHATGSPVTAHTPPGSRLRLGLRHPGHLALRELAVRLYPRLHHVHGRRHRRR